MISAIVAFRERLNEDGTVNDNIDHCIEYLSKCHFISEIILVHQDDKPFDRQHILDNPLVNIIENNYGGPFSKAWALNIGIKHSTTQIVAIVDSDCIMPENYLYHYSYLTDSNYCISYFIYTQGLSHARELLSNWQLLTPQNQWSIMSPECGGHILIKKSVIYRIGGYNERIRSWGWEDNELMDRLEHNHITRAYTTAHNTVFHLPHKLQDRSHTTSEPYLSAQKNNKLDYVQPIWGEVNYEPQFYF